MKQAVDLVEVILGKSSDLPKVEDAAFVELLLLGLCDATDLFEIVLFALRLWKALKR